MEVTVSRIATIKKAGTFSAEIMDFRNVLDQNGEKILNKNECPGYEVTYKLEGEELPMTDVFWWDQNVIWKVRKFLRAIRIKKNKKSSVTGEDLLGKKLWICIRKVDVCDAEGTVIDTYYEVFDHRLMTRNNRPSMAGDPDKNGGEPMKQFYKLIKPETPTQPAPEPIAESRETEEEEIETF